MKDYDENSDYEVNYIFQLLDSDGDVLDQTSLIENNPDLAMSLFMGEFGWEDRVNEGEVSAPLSVKLDSFEDPDLYDDFSNFELSSTVREDGRSNCCADPKDKKEMAELESCPMYERDEDAMSSLHYCKWCWAQGFKSVCERKPKENI